MSVSSTFVARRWSKSVQLDFLEKIAKEFNITKPQDWGKITRKELTKRGAGFIGAQFGNSVFRALKSNYPNIRWRREWFRNLKNSPGYWREAENHRNFLLEFASKLKIENPKDWGKISNQDMMEHNGATLLRIHGNSILTMLRKVFPETNWKEEWFPNSHLYQRKYWKSQENHKTFFLKLQKELNINHPSEWGQITSEKIRNKSRGNSVLSFYGFSLRKALQYTFPEIEWKREWFVNANKNPSGHWNLETQRKFLTNAANALGIREPKDWGNIKLKQLIEIGGKSILNEGLFEVLRNAFPETTWEENWFFRANVNPKGYWKKKENLLAFMDSVGKQLGVKKPSDWGKVTLNQFKEQGGVTLLSHFKGSLFRIVQSVYKDIEWDPKWFRIPSRKFPPKYFESFKNQLNFFESLASQYNLNSPTDWKTVSCSLIKKRGGGPLLARYSNSLQNALKAVYPSQHWIYSQSSSSPQKSFQNWIVHY